MNFALCCTLNYIWENSDFKGKKFRRYYPFSIIVIPYIHMYSVVILHFSFIFQHHFCHFHTALLHGMSSAAHCSTRPFTLFFSKSRAITWFGSSRGVWFGWSRVTCLEARPRSFRAAWPDGRPRLAGYDPGGRPRLPRGKAADPGAARRRSADDHGRDHDAHRLRPREHASF